jgi:predicted GIY-YIG superfamily endonuclease
MKIEVELDRFEVDTLAEMLHDRILEHRQGATADYVDGKISDAELAWHQSHADYVEGIARKLFPNWAS